MSQKMKHLIVAIAVFTVFCTATRAEAQGVAASFDQLSVLVGPGDTITVVDAKGSETKGQIGKLSRDSLMLLTASGPRALSEADVSLIRQRRGDSLKNGAIIGAVAATAYVLTAIALLGDSDGGDIIVSTAITSTVLIAGMGAAAGAGIDALIKGNHVIYRKPSSGSRISVSPLLGRNRGGVAVTLRF